MVIPQTRVTFNDNQWETNQRTNATTWPTATSGKCLSNTPVMRTQLYSRENKILECKLRLIDSYMSN